MRGKATRETGTICLINVEAQLGADHPLREVKRMCKEVLKALEPDFERMYAAKGRPSIPPERLLMAWVLMCLYGVRSCRRFDEELPKEGRTAAAWDKATGQLPAQADRGKLRVDESLRKLPQKPVDRGGEDELRRAVCWGCVQPDADGETVACGGKPAATSRGGVSRKGLAMSRCLGNEANRAGEPRKHDVLPSNWSQLMFH